MMDEIDGYVYQFDSRDREYKYYFSQAVLGCGAYGSVYRCLRVKANDPRKKEIVAIKKIILEMSKNKDIELQLQKIKQEIELAVQIKHKNAVETFDWKIIETKDSKNTIYLKEILIIMDYCNGGSFTNYLQKIQLSEKDKINYCCQMVDAVECLHHNNIFHRDIKPDNLLLKDGVLKIADFGTSKRLLKNEVTTNTFQGTPLFCAPEILIAQPYVNLVDIFSLGVTFYYFYCLKTPWENWQPNISEKQGSQMKVYNAIKDFEKKVKEKKNPFPENVKINEEMKNLILQMLKIEPSERPTITEIKATLNKILKSTDLDQSINSKLKFVFERVIYEYENLLFLHDTLEILYKLLNFNIVNRRESLKKVIFLLVKMHFYLVSYLFINLKNEKMQIWFPKEIWREFYESDDYCDLVSALRLMQNTSKRNFENIQTSYDEDQMKKYFNNQDIGVDFLIDLENYGCKLLEENLDLLENYDEKETEERTLIYKGLYGLILILTWKNSLGFKKDKKRAIINWNDNLESIIRKKIFLRIKNSIKMLI